MRSKRILRGKQRIKPMLGTRRGARNIEPDPAETWRANQDEQRRFGLASFGEVMQASLNEIDPW